MQDSLDSPTDPRRPSRRDLMRFGLGAAAASFALGGLPLRRLLAGDEVETSAPLPHGGQAKQVVFLYMIGGASQFETLDPKPGTATGGPTRTVDTTVAGIRLAASLPLLAQRMKDLCLVRSMTSREGNHDRARYLLHTGYSPTPTVTHASFGSMTGHEKGDPDAEIPNYVAIGGPGAGPGFLGVHESPFVVQDAQRPLSNVELPPGLSEGRRNARLAFLEKLNDRFARDHGDAIPEAQQAMFQRARKLMDSKKLVAFDLTKEKTAVREAYGMTTFGQNCLLARRLVEAGVPAVEVMMNGWDTHDDDFNRVKALNADLDKGMAAFLDDLKATGLLASTLVVWVGDFGRTPKITATDGRGHYPAAWSTMLAGGGVQGGRVVGSTNATGEEIADRPVTVPDLFASFAHALGLDPRKTFHTPVGRPITIVDKDGKPIPELFA